MSRGRRGRRRGGPRPFQDRPPGEPGEPRPQAQAQGRPPPTPDDGPLPDLPPEAPLPPRDADGEDVFLASEEGPPPKGYLAHVVGVRLRETGRVFEYDSGNLQLRRGERVVVDTDGGTAIGTVAVASARALTQNPSLRRVLRRADANDLRQEERSHAREHEALRLCRERARARGLDIQVARAESAQGGGKVTVYFSAEQRLDFRDLVRDLTQELHARVDMRQIGARDAAKIVGGVGDCGRELCCSTFLVRFEPISIRAAKEQNLPLNPAKLAGHCGRLKCCLVYEVAQYAEAKKTLPRVGASVSTPKGDGRVHELDILRRRVRVAFLEGGFETFVADELRPVGAPPPEPEPPQIEEPVPGVPEG
jgi:cell fate regulator YaaT (PSP1 superfamily)